MSDVTGRSEQSGLEPGVGRDPETQEMLRKAEQDFPNLEPGEALQMEANMGEGREAEQGEGQATGVVESMKEAVGEVVDAAKELNPATRDMKEPHC